MACGKILVVTYTRKYFKGEIFMKKNVFIFALFICAAVMVFGQSESDFEINEAGGKITITKYIGTVKDVKIPEKIKGLPVTAIGNSAFTKNKITNITIPNSITTIGNEAFYENQLTSVTIPNSVTAIGYWAFHSNRLTSVTIPDSVTTIDNMTFCNNQLTSVIIPNSVTIIKEHAFHTNRLTSVTIPNSVTTIGPYAFFENRLTSIVIPDSVTTIGNGAFLDNRLTSVTLPDNVKMQGNSFGYYSIYGQYISNEKKKRTFTISQPATINGYEVVIINNTAVEILKYGGNEKDVKIPERINGQPVTAIGTSAFERKQLTGVTIPNSVTVIGDSAFLYNQLTGVTIPNFVAIIGSNAFQSNQLTNITIPNSVSVIGENAFRFNKLTSITIPNSVIIYDYAFLDNQLTSITIGANVGLGRNSLAGTETIYNNGGKQAVTFTRPDTSTKTWTIQKM